MELDIEEQYNHLSGHLVPYEASIRPAEDENKVGKTRKNRKTRLCRLLKALTIISLLDDMESIIASTRSLKTPMALLKTGHWLATLTSKPRMRVQMMSPAKYKGTQMKEKHLKEMIEKKVTEAKEVCGGNDQSDECRVAWDEVEEVSEARAHLREKLEKDRDPLEPFCNDNPETEECRVNDDD